MGLTQKFKSALRLFLRQLLNLRGLATVPGLIAIALWALSLATLTLDATLPHLLGKEPAGFFYTDYETARSVLSTIASSSITTLGLVYSIVLVVFTTAAGNIGPRLLKRFTSDRVNQATAGLFGGTFLFALTVLHQTNASFVPTLSIAVTFFLAGLSVLQLIFFVHSASQSVTVDEEIAEIALQMEREIDAMLQAEGMDDYASNVPELDECLHTITAQNTGYITHINMEELIEKAAEANAFFIITQSIGNFVLKGQTLIRYDKKHFGDDDRLDELSQAFTFSLTRAPNSDINFSINLLIEIALRALSPGINDTFTAITCTDRLSSALLEPVKRGLRDHIRSDGDRIPRLILPGFTAEDLVNLSFNPLRRAAVGNILMSQHLLYALGRLHELASENTKGILAHHGRQIVESNRKKGLLATDMDYLVSLFEDRLKGEAIDP